MLVWSGSIANEPEHVSREIHVDFGMQLGSTPLRHVLSIEVDILFS